MVITLDEETLKDIELAKWYEADQSFLIHCGLDLIRLYDEQQDQQ